MRPGILRAATRNALSKPLHLQLWARSGLALNTCTPQNDCTVGRFHNAAPIKQQQHQEASSGRTTSAESQSTHSQELPEEDDHAESQHHYVLSSGTEVIEHEHGNGAYPEEGEYVSLHCVGRLKDDTVFEDTYKQGQPMVFVHGATQVVIGLEEALSHLRVGTKATVIVPGYAAYGYKRQGVIPPNSTLYFDVHVLAAGDDVSPPNPSLFQRIKEFLF
eukprot:gb/GECG01015268.1/.p1 GENE.gb/GECG01015268.1/~~gb/GECG01015268.1/.p1  ORF type:complete len:218 (+),score=28.14 gb/GECG01015268.1/:1-654(+)